MNLNLPFVYEVAIARRRGSVLRVYRDTVVVEIGEASSSEFDLAFERRHRAGFIEPTWVHKGRLFREVRILDRPITPLRFQQLAVDQTPDFRPTIDELWPRFDFPRPPYVRSLLFSDRNALFTPHGPPPFAKVLSFGTAGHQLQEARTSYERDIIIVDGCVRIAVPPPALVLRQRRDLEWYLTTELQPTIWDAARSFSISEREKALAFADEFAFDIVSKETGPITLSAPADWARPGLLELAASTAALAGESYPDITSVHPDSEAAISIIRQALTAIGGPSYPWEVEANPLDPRVRPQRLRRRWQFELRHADNQAQLLQLWRDILAIDEPAVGGRNAKPRITLSEDDLALAQLGPY